MRRVVFIMATGICLFTLCIPRVSGGIDFPTRTLQIVSCFPPGGSTGIIARILSPRLAEQLGKPVIVEHKAGAGGAVGLEFVAGSRPDGHTMVVIPPNILTIPYITPNVTFSYRNFQPISLAVNVPYLLLVNSKSPWKSLKDLVDYGKKNPGKLNYGGAGAGAVSTFTGEWFSFTAGMKITSIPYVTLPKRWLWLLCWESVRILFVAASRLL